MWQNSWTFEPAEHGATRDTPLLSFAFRRDVSAARTSVASPRLRRSGQLCAHTHQPSFRGPLSLPSGAHGECVTGKLCGEAHGVLIPLSQSSFLTGLPCGLQGLCPLMSSKSPVCCSPRGSRPQSRHTQCSGWMRKKQHPRSWGAHSHTPTHPVGEIIDGDALSGP